MYFITFAITAVFSVPFHTSIMARRGTRAGQSIVMELSTIVMLWSETAVFSQIASFVTTPAYMAFVAAFTAWPLFNCWLIRQLPEAGEAGTAARAGGAEKLAPARAG